ncbi:3-oxoacyl-[acyl-carrier-protein] synthase III C-terminal domain-containing protein [Desulfococcaceae bacterium HSG7]|nr:3-oxoacyl-[acyl-carrier-protein] synthase III C-terminal domain-containing protein [Desulfococcaceae bacterium HSG7]
MRRERDAHNDNRLFPHQAANKRIIDAVANALNLNGEQVCINISKYGDTTSATIPLAISEAYQNNMMQKGDRIILVDFRAGFTGGVAEMGFMIVYFTDFTLKKAD